MLNGFSLMVDKIKDTSNAQRLYLLGYTSLDIKPPAISQGYRIGVEKEKRIYLDDDGNFAEVLMTNGPITSSNNCTGTDVL